MKDLTLHCPVCGNEKHENKRYPLYVCAACSAKIEDESGRRLTITNTNTGDGIIIAYADTGEERKSRECLVQGVRCYARQAHFGGVVIQSLNQNRVTAPEPNPPAIPAKAHVAPDSTSSIK
jgi:hypothetical protein